LRDELLEPRAFAEVQFDEVTQARGSRGSIWALEHSISCPRGGAVADVCDTKEHLMDVRHVLSSRTLLALGGAFLQLLSSPPVLQGAS